MKPFRLMFSFPNRGKGKAAPTKWFSPATAKDQPTAHVASDFRTLLGKEMVDLHVGLGVEKVTYHVHKDLLCHRVEYFKNMFRSTFKEGIEGEAVLLEDPDAVDLLLGWIYTNTLPSLQDPTAHAPNQTYNPLALYILAEKYCLFPLMNLTMDHYRSWQSTNSQPLPESYYLQAYEECPPNSPMRKYVSHTLAYSMSGREEGKDLSDDKIAELMGQNGELCRDVVGLVRGREARQNPIQGWGCYFHRHVEGEACLSWKHASEMHEKEVGRKRGWKLSRRGARGGEDSEWATETETESEMYGASEFVSLW